MFRFRRTEKSEPRFLSPLFANARRCFREQEPMSNVTARTTSRVRSANGPSERRPRTGSQPNVPRRFLLLSITSANYQQLPLAERAASARPRQASRKRKEKWASAARATRGAAEAAARKMSKTRPFKKRTRRRAVGTSKNARRALFGAEPEAAEEFASWLVG